MNTNPDDTMLALWLDDELHGEELAAFESKAANRAEMLAAREEVRRWRAMIAAVLPAAEEPPYPDFFNTRVERAIRTQAPIPAVVPKRWFFRQSVFMPLAACAGMVLAFWLGAQTHTSPPEVGVVEGGPGAIPVEPFVYIPESGVKAERFASSSASATVIVLKGVAAIPDATDFSKTTSQIQNRKMDSTAELETDSNDPLGL
jgi:hypothetical protein